MQLRRAELGDVEAVHAILAESFGPLRHLYTPAAYAATVASVDALRARWSEGPTWLSGRSGTVGAVERPDGVYLRSMAVVPSARGGGIGRRLMEAVERFARDVGASRIYLSTTPFLDAAIRLYERHGFVRTDAPPHALAGTPLFTMEKDLSRTVGSIASQH